MLVVDDDPQNRDILRRLIERLGAEVFTARDGLDALRLFVDRAFDIVFLDLSMPGVDGYAAARAMRSFEAEKGRPRVPIVALSGVDDDPSILEAGIDDFMQKPVDSAALHEALERWTTREGT
ncbi:MAG: response regulator [Rectinemataceae bacterium]